MESTCPLFLGFRSNPQGLGLPFSIDPLRYPRYQTSCIYREKLFGLLFQEELGRPRTHNLASEGLWFCWFSLRSFWSRPKSSLSQSCTVTTYCSIFFSPFFPRSPEGEHSTPCCPKSGRAALTLFHVSCSAVFHRFSHSSTLSLAFLY